MATSGTYTFSPKVAECLDEAWERCGRDPSELDVRHIVSAKRSLNLLLRSELSGDRINLWTVAEHVPSTPAQAATSVSLPSGAIDVLEATARDSENNETPMMPIGRADWRVIPDKTLEGRPDRYWVERTTGTKTLHFWQAQGDPAYDLVLNVLYGIEDVGDLHNEADVPDLWYDVICAGLAKRLAVKFAPDRLIVLEAQFQQALQLAQRSNAEHGSLIITPDHSGAHYSGGRW